MQVKPYFDTYREVKQNELLLKEIDNDLKLTRREMNQQSFLNKKRRERLVRIGFLKTQANVINSDYQ